MTSVRIVWFVIGLLWVIAEIRLVRKVAISHHHIIDGERRSQGWLWLSVIGSLSLALYFKNLAWLPIPIPYFIRQWLSIMLCATGLGLRYWAVARLGRFFSTHVLIHNHHQLITDGPYKWMRHPAYTGLLLGLAGAGLAMGDVLALLQLTVIPFFAFALRITMEEQKLIKRFGQEYIVYLNKSYKLFPLLY